jgi:hypothetical protein
MREMCRRPGHRWENNVKMVIKEMGWQGVDQIHVTECMDKWQDFMNTNEPLT